MKAIGNIVLLTASWTCEYHTRVIEGICKQAQEEGYSVSVFVCQDGMDVSDKHKEGEYAIFSLPDLRSYDGAILFTETISTKSLKERILEQIKDSGIPAVSLTEEIEGMGFVGIDNYTSMHLLMEHMYKEHDCRRLHFIGGWKTNYATNERLRAFLDSAAEYKVKSEDCKIWYSDYTFEGGYELAKLIVESGPELPDAVICANDKMAIGVMTGLRALGCRVPQDIAVTGFDGNYDARSNAMRITTVSRPQEAFGERACMALIHTMRTKELDKIVMDTELSVRESCGCRQKEQYSNDDFLCKIYADKKRDERYNRLIRNMEDAMMECETLQELVFCIRQSISKILSEEIYLCLNQSVYYDMTGVGNVQYMKKSLVKGYEDFLYITKISHEDGIPIFEPLEKERLFYGLFDDEAENAASRVFVPLHFRDNCFGYLVLTGTIDMDRIPFYYAWIHNLSNSMENLQNMLALKNAICSIDNLAVKDSLTGVYNRTSINRFVVDMVKQANQTRKQLLFVFADVDHLKKINDVYGHEAGDQAICMVAKALKKVFGEDEMIIRYGGDEFLIVTNHYTQADVADRKRLLSELLEIWSKQEQVKFPLTASLGSYHKDNETIATMEQYINWADECMYRDKCANRREFKGER